MNKITRICLIRHGETAWNAELRLQGQRDLPLNAAGLAQASAVAAHLAGEDFVAIHCSDLLRARQTAQPLAEALGLSPVYEIELRERHFGCCEGLTVDEVLAGDPAVAAGFVARRPDYVLPGGESLAQHRVRIEDCLRRLANAYPGRCVAVVTHGGVLDLVYRRARDVPVERPRDFSLPNASINWLSAIDGDWRIDSWGETAHLGEHTPLNLVTRV